MPDKKISLQRHAYLHYEDKYIDLFFSIPFKDKEAGMERIKCITFSEKGKLSAGTAEFIKKEFTPLVSAEEIKDIFGQLPEYAQKYLSKNLTDFILPLSKEEVKSFTSTMVKWWKQNINQLLCIHHQKEKEKEKWEKWLNKKIIFSPEDK